MKKQLTIIGIIGILLVVGLSGCFEEEKYDKDDSNDQISEEVVLTTDKTEYKIGEKLNFTFINYKSHSIFNQGGPLPSPSPILSYSYGVQIFVNESWNEFQLVRGDTSKHIFDPVIQVIIDCIEYLPNSTNLKTISLTYFVYDDNGDYYENITSGRYRIAKTFYNECNNDFSPNWSEPFTVYSNEFTIIPAINFDISVNSSYAVGEKVLVTINLTNTGNSSINLSALSLEGNSLEFAINTPDGRVLKYIGPEIDCRPPQISLSPIGQVTIVIDLTDKIFAFGETFNQPYNFTTIGKYTIKAEYLSFGDSCESEEDGWVGSLTSKTSTFTIRPLIDFNVSINDAYIAGEPIFVTATLTNIGSDSVNIGAMGLEVGTLDFYITTPDAKTLHYIGPIVDFCAPNILSPNETIQVTYNLLNEKFGYNFTTKGKYSIRGSYNSFSTDGTALKVNMTSNIESFSINYTSIILNDSYYQNASRDEYVFDSIEINYDMLTINVSYGGGCEEHKFSLIASSSFKESDPVQIDVVLSHNANNDTCEAWITEELAFDLSLLKEAWKQLYGESGTIIINLEGFDESISYEF